MNEIEIIQPIIFDTYGESSATRALSWDILHRMEIPDGARSREERIMHICWNWMTGGGTAEVVAGRIERALVEAEL